VGADLTTQEKGDSLMSRITTRLGRLEAHKREPGIHTFADLLTLARTAPEPTPEERAHWLYGNAQAGAFAAVDAVVAASGFGPGLRPLLRAVYEAQGADLQARGILNERGHLVAGTTETAVLAGSARRGR